MSKASPPEGSLTFLTVLLDWKCNVQTHGTSGGAFHAQIATVGVLRQTWNTTKVGKKISGDLLSKKSRSEDKTENQVFQEGCFILYQPAFAV